MLFCRQAQSLTGHTIDALQELYDRLGFWPRLVFDRGFGNESIVEYLMTEGATVYVCLKAENYVACDGQKTKIENIPNKDQHAVLLGLTLRVIRSPKGKRAKQPWYILTNDMVSSRNKIVQIYYHRFEIEETFKDTKHIFELHRLQFNRPTSLKIVLWLVFLGITVLYVVGRPDVSAPIVHPRKFVSWIRRFYEHFQRILTSLRALTGMTPPTEPD